MSRNLGDFRLWRNVNGNVDRRNYTTRDGMSNVIFPENDSYEGDVVPLDGRQYDYYWWKNAPLYEDELGLLLDKGWRIATTNKEDGGDKIPVRVNRASFRSSPEGNVLWRGHILYARPAEIGIEEEKAKLLRDEAGRMLRMGEDALHSAAEEMGLGTYSMDGGEKKDVVKPRKR
jgi:hypothetical protein